MYTWAEADYVFGSDNGGSMEFIGVFVADGQRQSL